MVAIDPDLARRYKTALREGLTATAEILHTMHPELNSITYAQAMEEYRLAGAEAKLKRMLK